MKLKLKRKLHFKTAACVGMTTLLLATGSLCAFAASSEGSTYIINSKASYKRMGYKCSKTFDANGSRESFVAVRSICSYFGSAGQAQTDSTDLANTAFVPWGYTKFTYKVLLTNVQTTSTEWHVTEPGCWTTNFGFLGSPVKVYTAAKLKDDTYATLINEYTPDTDTYK